MSEVTLTASRREAGRKEAKRLRNAGRVPGVFYMNGVEPIPFSVHPLDLRPIVYTTEARIVKLSVEGESVTHDCVLKDISFDPITDKIVHIDLLGVRADKPVHVEIPVLLKGQAIGVRDGGLLEHGLHKLEVECLPKDMPEHIEVDVTNLALNHAIHVSELNIPNVKILSAPDAVVAAVVPPRVTGGEISTMAPAEPEIVGAKGKKEEE